jgi:hypothetical protein
MTAAMIDAMTARTDARTDAIAADRAPGSPGVCMRITAGGACWAGRSAGHPGRAGVSLPGRFGIRIEDIVAATEDGGRRLNNTSHETRSSREGGHP